MSAESAEAFFDSAEAAVDLRDVPNFRFPFRAQGGDEESHARADVGAGELGAAKFIGAKYHGAVGIAKNDAGTHFEKSVHKEEAGFEKFLVDKDGAFALGGGDEGDGSHVCGEAGPRSVGDVWNSSTELFFHLELLVLGDKNVLPLDFGVDAKPGECL